MTTLTIQQRFRGCLAGLACGDAVGTRVEFAPRGSFTPVTDMSGGGPFNLEPGQWTDDTSMALCLADSLLACGGFDAEDQMQRYFRWWKEGERSSTGRCFDIGNATAAALTSYQHVGDPFSGSEHHFSAGNGSLMRLAPVAMYYSDDAEQAIFFAGESSRTTHGAAECIDACRYFASLLFDVFNGTPKDELLSTTQYTPQTTKIRAISSADFLRKPIHAIKGSGYVVESLEAALWCFFQHNNFRDAILEAVNLGDDADTTAAICGQITGAYYGVDNIPPDWLAKISLGAEILDIADELIPLPLK